MRRKIIGLTLAIGLTGALLGVLGTTGVWQDAAEWAGLDAAATTTGRTSPPPAQTSVEVVTVPDNPARPPNTPGPQPEPKLDKNGKPICAADPSYFDKKVDGLKDAAEQAWKRARQAAWEAGLTLCVHDGKRSTASQQAEFDAALALHGSAAKARQYVLPPEKSLHVKGLAVDVQPRASAAWLERTKGEFGWCRRYANEPWHFEYSAGYQSGGCPELLPHP
ncbi:D-alanyl-D-alanine carboxypeptidase family protein [Crossiella sp. SN42]|uniref:D-alanyl-D-alanine carboxypeptidase family protein n=1 Tax=Crossiella sp. SN42 TaxID=2944808 RepID=UPI00207C2CB4|nr:D-alanyl-D-alanine carboxypeptidase family protein [Crossiella sp. SN42]MCO1579344.1 D-alanyl-D-alanine carboxypeptidase family protein [Crossiella sp. SN42]